jgi:hypothetical protein
MSAANACPDPDAYRRLLHGELSPSDEERLSQHLAGCSSCVAAVQTVLSGDTLLPALDSAPADAPTGEEIPTDVTRRLLALAAPASASALTLPALNPPQEPGEIGRLAHYRVLKVLGEGGMGVVFLAEDTRLSRTVALKTMKPEIAADPQYRQRFLREARAAAKVEDDHIVPIYDVGEERGLPWLAMPFLKGQSLDAMLKRVDVLPPAQAARLGAQVARGLAAAHAAGLIHRDIKPANIWVEPAAGGRARLLDFGLARDQGPGREQGNAHLTRTGALVGTPAFMAPEQAEGQPLDARADLFSLGCVLYRAVTGRLPFQGDGILGTLAALATDTPPAPRDLNPDVPEPLSALIMCLLAKEPSARPASASAVAAALEAIACADRPELAVPQAPVLAPRRRWRLATVAALLLVLSGALAAGIVVIIRNKDGKEVGRLTVPEDGSLVIRPDGDDGKLKDEPVKANADRRAAEWVLSIGGSVWVRQEGQDRHVLAAKDLSAAPIEGLGHVTLLGNRNVDDAGLVHLKGLTKLAGLDLGDTRVGSAGLQHVEGLTSLTVLGLPSTRVTDAGLEHLKGLTNLVWLNLDDTQVSDAGLEQVKGLTNLKEIHLSRARVSNVGLEHLKGLTRLRVLTLDATRADDAGMRHLKGLTNLRDLVVSNTPVGDAGLEHVKGLPHLAALLLGGTRVGDAGLEHLKGLTNLTSLNLYGTRVSDAGLKHLAGLSSLKDLDLTGTQVTADGVAALHKALPKCKIVSGPR